MFRTSAGRVVLVVAICLGLSGWSCGGGGEQAARALSRSGDDALRAAPELVDALPQIRTQLQDVRLASGTAPWRAVAEQGITLSSGVRSVSAEAVAESALVARFNKLLADYTDAYKWTCKIAKVIEDVAKEGNEPTPEAVWARGQWDLRADFFNRAYNIVHITSDDSNAEIAFKLLIWGGCLPTKVPAL
jgi:hypothetical protein